MNKLEITQLSKTYPTGVKALDQISLTITNGMFGLLGPNGAGKSTLMRTLAMLQEAESGNILFNGIDVQNQPDQIRSVLGYLPQEFGVYPKVSAENLLDHIAVLKGIANRNERREQINFLLQQTNLLEHRKKAVYTFSGGMRQRFGIAQALLGNPKLIIVDEPTAGLDPEERNRFLNLLSEIGEHIIVILSTHLVDDVLDLCSRMAILHQGRILCQGSPLALTESLSGKVWVKKVHKSELPHYRQNYCLLSSKLVAGEIKVHLKSDYCPDPGFEPVTPNLEDFYFSTLNTATGNEF